MYYSMIGILAILILFIVNRDILLDRKASFGWPAWRIYRQFLLALLVYYVTDVLWGFLESWKLAVPLFADTTVYFIAMAAGILYWGRYTVTYLEEETPFGRFLMLASNILAAAITVLSVANIFVPILFTVDSECVYSALPTRYGTLSCQILLLLLISGYAFTRISRHETPPEKRQRYKILAAFGLIMAVFLVSQMWFPYLPMYSIAYMLATCILHSFVANDEKEEYMREMEEAEKVTELKDTIISLLNNIPGMTFTKDAQTGVYLACNQAFAEYAHKEHPEEVAGLTDEEIFDAETAAHFAEDDRIALSLSKPYVFFEDVPDAAGNRRQLQTTKLKYTDTTGRLCVLGVCQDVTDMVRIEHENAMTKEAYENAVSSGLMYTHMALTLARDYTDMFYVNTDSEEYIEYGRGGDGSSLSETRRGFHFFSDCVAEMTERVDPDDRDAFRKAMNRKTLMKALSLKNTFIMTYRQNDGGHPVYVNMKVSRMVDDEKFVIVGITNVDAEMRAILNAYGQDGRRIGVESFLQQPLIAANVIGQYERIARRNSEAESRGKKRANLAGRRVLVAEDQESNAEIMADILSMESVLTDRAGNGREAVDLFRNSPAGTYAAILMDARMPEMDGLEAAEAIRAMDREDAKRIPIIALTANAFDEDVQRSVQTGMNAYLSKPVESDQLVRILGELICEAEQSGP